MADQTYLFLAHVPTAGVDDYRRFVTHVLPLITESGGRLERRLTADDTTVEIFVVSLPSTDAFEELQTSTHTSEAALWLYRSGARFEALPLARNPIATMS